MADYQTENKNERNSGQSTDSGFTVTSDPYYQLTTRSVGRQLPQRHILDSYLRAPRPPFMTGCNVSVKSYKKFVNYKNYVEQIEELIIRPIY